MQFPKMILTCICICLLPLCPSQAQEISGTWLGNYNKRNKHELKMDIELYNDSLIRGVRTQYYGNGKYESFSISGTFNKHDSTVIINEDAALSQNADGFGDKGSYFLRLFVYSDKMRLQGEWKNSGQSWFTSMSSKVVLEKDLVVASSSRRRKPDIVHTVYIDKTDADSIKIEVWDYERIDNDIISVFLNDSLVLDKWKISGSPKVIYLSLNTAQQEYIISMVAESQGAIPPCTADIRIVTRHKTEKFKLKSDTGQNAGIAIRLK